MIVSIIVPLLLIVLLIMQIRTWLVYRIRTKAIDAVYEISRLSNYTIKPNRNVYGSHIEMLFDFRKWKFKHFYPDLEQELLITRLKY